MLAFARVREVLGFGEREVDLLPGSTAGDAWTALVAGARSELPSTRFARNGTIVDGATVLADGDELALLPPVSGG